MDYILKHKNKQIISFSMNEEYNINKIIEIHNNLLLPMGHKFINNELYISNNLQKWIDERGLPETRTDKEDLYKYGGAKNSKELMLGSYGLNLSDQYWIHRSDKMLYWEDLNFFDNKFKDIMQEIEKKEYTNDKVNPNLSVNGTLSKYWYIDSNNDRILAKKGRNIQWQEPFNEAITSDILELLNIENVHYDLRKNENNEYVSLCKCMINKHEDLIPAAVVLNMEERKGRNNYNLFIDTCKNNGINNAREYLDKMIFIDYILGNDDRHTYNFGVIRNADNLKWLNTTPLFDNGNILFYDYQFLNNENIKESIHCRWFEKTNDEKLKYIEYPKWYNNKNIYNIFDIINKYLSLNEKVNIDKKNMVINTVKYRIQNFENIMEDKFENKNNKYIGMKINEWRGGNSESGEGRGVEISTKKDNDNLNENNKIIDKERIVHIQIETSLDRFVNSSNHLNMNAEQLSKSLFTNINNDIKAFSSETIEEKYKKFANGYNEVVKHAYNDMINFFNNGEVFKNYSEYIRTMKEKYDNMENEYKNKPSGDNNDGIYKAILNLKYSYNKIIRIINDHDNSPPPPPLPDLVNKNEKGNGRK